LKTYDLNVGLNVGFKWDAVDAKGITIDTSIGGMGGIANGDGLVFSYPGIYKLDVQLNFDSYANIGVANVHLDLFNSNKSINTTAYCSYQMKGPVDNYTTLTCSFMIPISSSVNTSFIRINTDSLAGSLNPTYAWSRLMVTKVA
jgi:hypothetical protein